MHDPGNRHRVPSRHNGLDTCFQLDDTDLSLFVKVGGLNIEQMRPPGKAIRLVLVIEGIEHLDCIWQE